MYRQFGVMTFLTIMACGCGGSDKEEAAAPAAPTLTAPVPIPAPPPVVSPAPEAAVENAPPANIVVSTNPDAMVIVPQTPFKVVGRASDGLPDEKMIAKVPTAGADRFIVSQPAVDVTATPAAAMTQRLPAGFTPLLNYGVDVSGYPKRILCERVKSEMAFVPAGVFQMGADDGPEESRPQHAMYVDAYYIDVTETPLASYQMLRDEQKARKQRVSEEALNASDDLQKPALGVSFSGARAFAKWSGRDLPTEVEWEKAARGTEGFVYPWGNGRPAWTKQKELQGVQLPGSEPTDVSIYGVKDLAGNAREWCLDHFAPDAYPKLLADAKDIPRNWTGPRNPTEKFERTVKGNGPDWKLSHRDGVVVTENVADIGFRCVLRFYDVE
ncbi:formylglycine-generating enzyme family protein [Lacunimicrobium album]